MMTTADWAFVVSLFSALISLGGLAWNIWSKFIHPKPRIRVRFAVMNVIGDGGLSDPFLALYATNFGPTDTTLQSVVCRTRKTGWRHWFRDRWQWAMLVTANDPQFSIEGRSRPPSGLPHKLVVGAEFGAYLVFDHSGFRENNIVDVGFADIFGRNHWAPRKAVRNVRDRVREGKKPTSAA